MLCFVYDFSSSLVAHTLLTGQIVIFHTDGLLKYRCMKTHVSWSAMYRLIDGIS